MRANLQNRCRLISPFSTNRHQFKTIQHPDFKSTNDNLQNDTPLVLSEDHGSKLEQMKWYCPSNNNSIFITE